MLHRHNMTIGAAFFIFIIYWFGVYVNSYCVWCSLISEPSFPSLLGLWRYIIALLISIIWISYNGVIYGVTRTQRTQYYTRTDTHIHIHTPTHTPTHTPLHTHTHTHTLTHTQLCRPTHLGMLTYTHLCVVYVWTASFSYENTSYSYWTAYPNFWGRWWAVASHF